MKRMRRTNKEVKRFPFLFVLLGAWKTSVCVTTGWNDLRMADETLYYVEHKGTMLTGSELAQLDAKAYRHITYKCSTA